MTSHRTQALLLRAASFAAERHRTQKRKDGETPYINHPLQLATLLANDAEVTDDVVLAAALLHDTIEDTGTTREELVGAFGEEVASVVCEVTDDKSLPKAKRKEHQVEHATGLSDRAKLVKMADKICNLRDILEAPPVDWPLSRRQEYFDWCYRVVSAIGEPASFTGPMRTLRALFDVEMGRRP